MPQFALEVGPSNDSYEREADAVANAVVADEQFDGISGGAAVAQRMCSSCAGEDEELQRSPSDAGHAAARVSSETSTQIARARAGGGTELPSTARGLFEPRFGADFSDVRVHRGSEASALSRQLHARAFTVGRDIFFGTGQYDLGGARGRHLLAHELTHTIQQGGARDHDL